MFIFGIIMAVIAVIALIIGIVITSRPTIVASIVAFLIGAALFLSSMFFTQGVGEARVIVNFDGTVAGQATEPGLQTKAPWTRTIKWDLFSQNLTYAGNSKDGAPKYSGGDVNGYEVTSSVARGAQVNFDLSVTYSIDADSVAKLYRQYQTQERFTKQIIEQQVLSVVRDVPTNYTPVEFRGDKRGAATKAMVTDLNKALGKYGVKVQVVSLQNITYTDQVEKSIRGVEVAQQKQEKAEADLRAAEVSARQKQVEAEAEAKANSTIAKSLTPEVLQSRQLDTLEQLGKDGNTFIVPNGSNPLIQVQK